MNIFLIKFERKFTEIIYCYGKILAQQANIAERYRINISVSKLPQITIILINVLLFLIILYSSNF